MPKIDIVNLNKEKVGELDLNDKVFGVQEINHALFYEIVKAQLASRRSGTHSAKGRSAVSGSKKKLYKQKGTGRARHGSLRAPVFVKGGQAHPPIPRSYSYRPPRSVRLNALRHALSLYAKEGRLVVVNAWDLPEIKTKSVAQSLGKLTNAPTVIVDVNTNEKLRFSTNNLQSAAFLPPEGVNVYDILRHERLVLTQTAVKALEQRLSAEN